MRKGKSSLVDHRFPNFYACYLLRSVKTPRSQSTYIGSTPNPPRRLRQHNGDLTAGAWKTSRHRPWVMQLIVYGFPSKLAALQFEWAWQHPGISRHVRGGEGIKALCQTTRTRYLKANIQILRLMLSMSPYNMWPLHVKIFTEEALKIWGDVEKAVSQSAYLPLGFTYSIELEGVDGKSGKKGSGRTNAIEVNDEVFTAAYLKKHTSLLSRSPQKPCSICKESLDISSEDSLTISLCPHSNCEAVSHISCLAREFLIRSGPSSQDSAVIPRGGSCGSCNQYTLWGDIIRGCHRRRPLHIDAQLDDDGGVEEDSENGEIFTGEESDSASYVEGLLPLPDGAKTCGIKSATTIKKVAQIPAKLSTARNKLNPEPLSEYITKTAKKPAKISARQPSTKESDSNTVLGILPRRRTKKIVTGSKSLHTSSVRDSREFLDLGIVSSHRHSEPLSPARFHNERYTNQVLGHQGWTAPTPERRSLTRHRSVSREAFDLKRPFILEFKEDEKSNRSSSIDSVELEQEFRRGVNIPKGAIIPAACQSPKGATSVVIPSCISSSPLEYEMSVLSISSPTHSPCLSQYSLRSGTISDNCDVIVLSD